jgi:hypothetical protein
MIKVFFLIISKLCPNIKFSKTYNKCIKQITIIITLRKNEMMSHFLSFDNLIDFGPNQ